MKLTLFHPDLAEALGWTLIHSLWQGGLINLLLSALEMLLFYHPVFWWINNQIQQERELCCDDIAVAACGNRKLYARTLLLMEEKHQQNSLAMAYQGKKNHLLDRIKRICLASPASYRPEFGKAGLSLTLLLAVAAMSWAKMPDKPKFAEDIVLPETVVTPDIPAADLSAFEILVAGAAVKPENLSTPASTMPSFPSAASTLTVLGGRADTIPYVPNIPAMRNEPKLPPSPSFPYTKEALQAELQKNGNDHQFLRNTIAECQTKITQWQNQVKQEYLKAWTERQEQINKAYTAWKDDLKSQSENDELELGS